MGQATICTYKGDYYIITSNIWGLKSGKKKRKKADQSVRNLAFIVTIGLEFSIQLLQCTRAELEQNWREAIPKKEQLLSFFQ